MTEKATASGFGLCIGLNHVCPLAYGGWSGRLSGCIPDADSMLSILQSRGFATKRLINEMATAEGILGSLEDTRGYLKSGDLLVVTYSGHGGQMLDPWGVYGTVSTLCAYDRQILGHELGAVWARMPVGVRVLVISDSCHSGTVTRDYAGFQPPVRSPRGSGYLSARDSLLYPVVRAIPDAVQAAYCDTHRELYRALFRSPPPPPPPVPVLLLGGCQDSQTSADGPHNGLFTDRLLGVWSGGAFVGDYPAFHAAIVSHMPSTQTPSWFYQGPEDTAFTSAEPFTI